MLRNQKNLCFLGVVWFFFVRQLAVRGHHLDVLTDVMSPHHLTGEARSLQ